VGQGPTSGPGPTSGARKSFNQKLKQENSKGIRKSFLTPNKDQKITAILQK
jgi:hypothetical protein